MSTELSIPASPKRKPSRSRKLLISAIIIILILILGTFGLSYYVGYSLTHPARKPLSKSPTDLGLSFQNISFPSRTDHLKIQGWLIPASSKTDKIVIEAHGFRGNRTDSPILPTAKALHDSGISVMMFDFRDEGTSPGSEVSVGMFEERDLLGAVDYAKSLGYKHIGVIGYSMGAATTLLATADDPDVAAAVADSPFADLHSYLSQQMPHWTHLPNWPFTPEVLFEIRVFLGLDASKVSPLKDLAHWSPRPLLLIHGTSDHTIDYSNSEELYKEVQGDPDDQLWLVPGADHVGSYKVNPTAYETRVVSFFTQYLH